MAGPDAFEKYFLESIDSDDFFFRAPRRFACQVEPLIDRAHAFQAMEQAIVKAKQTVHLAGWVFFPETPLLDSNVRKIVGGRNWLDLIRFVVTQKTPVNVRIIITDFDPFFEPGNHRLCWRSLSSLMKLRSSLPSNRREKLEFIGSLHEYFITPSFVTLGLFSVEDAIKAEVAKYNKMPFSRAIKRFRRTPGHWSSIRVDTTKKKFEIGPSPEKRAFPASHHQKFCTIDGFVAFCGGMDITPLAHDTRAHRRRRHPFKRGKFDLSWHDIHARIEGSVVNDIEHNFRERWNQEILAFNIRLTAFAAATPKGGVLPISSLNPMPDLGNRAATMPGSSVVQSLRTVSINKDAQFLPDLKRKDILDAYSAVIGSAQHFIYMENQYFRSPEITDLIIARHRENQRLQFILVIPIAPEELTDPKSADPKVLHPIAIQIKQIERLKAALGNNFGVFSLVLRAKSTKKTFTDAFGSPQIYVHSKICVVDDEYATIGSANINGRSFRMDSELNIGWFHSTEVHKFRLMLWKHLLGNQAKDILKWDKKSFVARWRSAAALNAKQPAKVRDGLVIEHNNELFKDVAKEFPLIPNVFINIHDVLPESMPLDLIEFDEAREDISSAVS